MSSHPARTRLISSLRKQFIPPSEGPGLRLSVHSFRSLSSSLFLLLASLHATSASNPDVNHHRATPTPSDLHLVQDSINKVLSGSLEVDEQSILEEYGTNSSSADSRSQELLKRALTIESLLRCIENSPGPGEWILQNTLDVFVYLILGFSCFLCDSLTSNIGHHARIKHSQNWKALFAADAWKHSAAYLKPSFKHHLIPHLQKPCYEIPLRPLHLRWTPRVICLIRVVLLGLFMS